MDPTTRLAEHAASTAFADVPAAAVDDATRSIRNIAGVALFGSRHAVGETVRSYLDALGAEGPATLVGGGSADAVRAAFANGAFAHVMNYNDTFESVVIHPSPTAFPAALAAGEVAAASGRDLLVGYVVGLDVCFRIGRAVAPSHWHRGFHSTATVGTFGAAAAAASVLGLPATETEHAFGLAGSFAAGLKENIGTPANPIHTGHAAANGLKAALLARSGAVAAPAILDGEYGYGRVTTEADGYDPTEITDPAVEWAVTDNALKPYPSGVVTHSAMEALRSIVAAEDLDPEDVATITATVDEGVMDTIDEHDPRDAVAANVSYEFCLAAVLREREVGLEEFTDAYVNEPATREAMAKVALDPRPNPFDTGGSETSYGARVAVETADGRRFEEAVTTAPGGPSNPLPEERWRRKFHECAATVLDREAAERLAAVIDDLGEADRELESLTSALAPE